MVINPPLRNMSLEQSASNLFEVMNHYYSSDTPTSDMFSLVQDEMTLFFTTFNKNWTKSENYQENIWQGLTDHLTRWMDIPYVRQHLPFLLTTISTLRCIVREECAKEQFDGYLLVYEVMQDHLHDATLQLESWMLLYNVCINEDNKHTFISTKGLNVLTQSLQIMKSDARVMNELLDTIINISSGKRAHYRFYFIQKANFIPYIMEAMVMYTDKEMLMKLCETFSYLAITDSSESQAVKLGGQQLICSILQKHQDMDIHQLGVRILRKITRSVPSHEMFQSFGGIPFINHLFHIHSEKQEIIEQLVLLVGNLSCSQPTIMDEIDLTFPSQGLSRFTPSPLVKEMVRPTEIENKEFQVVVEFDKNTYEIYREIYIEEKQKSENQFKTMRKPSFCCRAPSLYNKSFTVNSENDSFSPFEFGYDIPSESVEDVPNEKFELTGSTTIIDILVKLLNQTKNSSLTLSLCYTLQLVAKTPCAVFELVNLGMVKKMVELSFSVNPRIARNACGVLYQIGTNFPIKNDNESLDKSNDEFLVGDSLVGESLVGEKDLEVNEKVLIDFFTRNKIVDTFPAIRFLMMYGFKFSHELISKNPSLLEFYQKVQRHFVYKKQTLLDECDKSKNIPFELLGLVSEFLHSSEF